MAFSSHMYYNVGKLAKEALPMTVTIDTTRCIGCGMCAYTAPTVFRIVGRYSTVLAQPDDAVLRKVSDAANGCPVNAIALTR